MKTLKLILLLLLTAALLFGCAVLPVFAAWLQDKSTEAVRYSDLQPMYLELNSETPETESASNLIRKFALLQQCFMFPISSDAMHMTEDEVLKAAMAALTPYIEMGLIPDCQYPHYTPQATVAVSADNLGDYLPFWSVVLAKEEAPYQSVTLHIDDETGDILYINLETYYQEFYKEDHSYILESLGALFLEKLQDPIAALNDPNATVDLVDLTDRATALSCTINTTEYGKILIEIYLTSNGFFTAFPSSPD